METLMFEKGGHLKGSGGVREPAVKSLASIGERLYKRECSRHRLRGLPWTTACV